MRNMLNLKNLTGNGIDLLLFLLCFPLLFIFANSVYCDQKPEITEQVVFLYYADLEKSADFYESVMGFKEIEQTSSIDWVAIYQTANHSYIGIVDEGKGFLTSSPDKPVMLSWVTRDVDGWFQYLKERDVDIIRPPEDNLEAGIRGMIFRDPGGYTLELFQWIN